MFGLTWIKLSFAVGATGATQLNRYFFFNINSFIFFYFDKTEFKLGFSFSHLQIQPPCLSQDLAAKQILSTGVFLIRKMRLPTGPSGIDVCVCLWLNSMRLCRMCFVF